jgi:mannitol/fructose-specific phosphotransferase system IIA component (Ntr-type)
MNLSDYLPAEHIITNLQGSNKIELIDELLLKMKDLNLLLDYDDALNDVMAREGYLSTGLENGLAIPHAKTKGIDKLAMVFGLKVDGVEFETLDNKPAQLIFLVLSPPDTSGPHIQALAMITRNLKDESTRKKILTAQSATEMAEVFKSFN